MTRYLDAVRLALGDVTSGAVIPFPLFPIGEWKSAKYPELPLTRELAETLIANFDSGVLGTEPMVDSSGKHDTSSPAAAWLKRLYIAPTRDGGEMLMADGQLTEVGAQLLGGDLYKYLSVEIDAVTDNRTGVRTANVLKSATLTNTPVLRIMPAVLDAPEYVVALAEIAPVDEELPEEEGDDSGESEGDPVEEALDQLEELANRLDLLLKGQRGVPVVRTLMREVRHRVKSSRQCSETDTDAADDAQHEGSSEAVPGATGKVDEGQHVQAAEGQHSESEEPMKTVLNALQLSEAADEATVLAAVQQLISERDTATVKLAETEAAARTAAVAVVLDELVSGGHVAPGQREAWAALAEHAPEQFDAMAEAARMSKVIDLSEHGAGSAQSREYDDPSVELAERATAALAAGKAADIVAAQDLVLAEDSGLADRYFGIIHTT